MKNILISLIVLCMTFGLVACSETIEDKVAQEIANKVISEVADTNDVSIDSDEGKITISDGDNQLVVEGSESGMFWPSDKLPEYVPELEGVKVISVANVNDNVIIVFEGCDEDEILAYIEQIESSDWNIIMDMREEDSGVIMTNNNEGETVTFVWDTTEQEGSITYIPTQQ